MESKPTLLHDGSTADGHGPQGAPAGQHPAPPALHAGTRRNQRLALLALAGMALGWGYNWVVMKQVLAYVGPFDFSALRSLFAAVALLAVLVLLRRPMTLRAWPRVLLLGLLQTGAFSALAQLALLQGDAGKTSFLVYTMPFWVISMAWVLLGERVRGLQWVALALAAVGLVLILAPWRAQSGLVSSLLAVGAGFVWGLATIVAKWIKRDHPMDALPLTAWQMLFGALSLCIAAWLIPERPIEYAPYFYGALIYNTVIATAIAWFLWLFALQHLSAGVAGMATLGVPVVGSLAGWLQLDENPDRLELGGMVLIALALLVLSAHALRAQRG